MSKFQMFSSLTMEKFANGIILPRYFNYHMIDKVTFQSMAAFNSELQALLRRIMLGKLSMMK
jgi:hypothetical protein